MTEKPKTIYKNGLRWNLLPKEVYGKEVYVPCNTLYHYWSLGIKGRERMTEKRFEIKKSAIIDGARVIKDNEKKYTFATTFETATLINYRKALNELNDENKQLKSTIKEVTELLSDEVDLFSEKATEHDIIAYVELQELDNKDAFYMATATKEAIKILKRCLND